MVAAVVGEPAERGVRELLFLDVVPLAQLERVDADLGRERVHRPFDRVGRLRPAGPAVRIGGRHCREHRSATEVVRDREVIDAGVEERAEQRHAGRHQLQIRTHVGQQADAHRGELALGVGREFDVLDLATAVDRGHRVLAALLVPAHRHGVLARQCDTQQLLGVDVELAAEATTDCGGNDPHVLLGDAEGECSHDLEDVRDLRRRVQRHVAAERLWHGGTRPRFHEHRQQPLLDIALLHGVRRGCEGRGRPRPRCSRISGPTCRPCSCPHQRGSRRGPTGHR